MPILDDFCGTLNQAISDYENAVQLISPYRQQEIQTLRDRINQCLQNRMDSVEFREEMVERIRNISTGVFAFIPHFDSRLRKRLLSVLNQDRFSEKRLLNRERTEDRTFYRSEIERLGGQITVLTQALDAERAKDNVQRVNELTRTVSLQQQNIDLLTTRNQQLQQSLNITVEKYQPLQTDYETLSKNYDNLKTKYEALLDKKGKSSSSRQSTDHSNHYSPLF